MDRVLLGQTLSAGWVGWRDSHVEPHPQWQGAWETLPTPPTFGAKSHLGAWQNKMQNHPRRAPPPPRQHL